MTLDNVGIRLVWDDVDEMTLEQHWDVTMAKHLGHSFNTMLPKLLQNNFN